MPFLISETAVKHRRYPSHPALAINLFFWAMWICCAFGLRNPTFLCEVQGLPRTRGLYLTIAIYFVNKLLLLRFLYWRFMCSRFGRMEKTRKCSIFQALKYHLMFFSKYLIRLCNNTNVNFIWIEFLDLIFFIKLSKKQLGDRYLMQLPTLLFCCLSYINYLNDESKRNLVRTFLYTLS